MYHVIPRMRNANFTYILEILDPFYTFGTVKGEHFIGPICTHMYQLIGSSNNEGPTQLKWGHITNIRCPSICNGSQCILSSILAKVICAVFYI